MVETPFEMRMLIAGLKLSAEEVPKLQALVRDLDAAAAALRGARPYGEEPASALRPKPG